jgi:hypothetical protein
MFNLDGEWEEDQLKKNALTYEIFPELDVPMIENIQPYAIACRSPRGGFEALTMSCLQNKN